MRMQEIWAQNLDLFGFPVRGPTHRKLGPKLPILKNHPETEAKSQTNAPDS